MVDYATRDEVRAYNQFRDTDTNNDSLLDDLITDVSRIIDNWTGRVFAPDTDSIKYFDILKQKYYDPKCPRDLSLHNEQLLSVTSITNADGSSIATSDVIELPRDTERKHTLRIKSTSTASWVSDPDGEIAIDGRWGYSATVPEDVKRACIEAVCFIFQQRGTQSDTLRTSTIISPDGAIIRPEALPPRFFQLLKHFKRKL